MGACMHAGVGKDYNSQRPLRLWTEAGPEEPVPKKKGGGAGSLSQLSRSRGGRRAAASASSASASGASWAGASGFGRPSPSIMREGLLGWPGASARPAGAALVSAAAGAN